MFSVMVTASDNSWEEGAYIWHASRIFEYTDDDIRDRLSSLTPDVLETLAQIPTLFMYERDTEGTPRVGTIKRIQQRGQEIRIIFEFDDAIPPLTHEQIERLKWELNLQDFEFNRTHWAVKRGDLKDILREAGHIENLAPTTGELVPITPVEDDRPAVEITPANVFLVHGRDEGAKHKVARFLENRVGLGVIVLNEKPNKGRSILTKFQEEANGASFAVVLMTGDDLGYLRSELSSSPDSTHDAQLRPRQNVIFELGFFIGTLGIDRVCALIPADVERPSDYDGIVYVPFDEEGGWEKKLVTELHAANVPVSETWWRT